MALQEPTKFACIQDVEMSGGTAISPVGLATEAARWDGVETGRRCSYLSVNGGIGFAACQFYNGQLE